RSVEALARSCRFQVLKGLGNFESPRIVNASTNIGDTYDFKSGLVNQQGRNAADVTASLNYDTRISWLHLESLCRFSYDNQQSPSGRFAPPPRSTEIDRFTRHDCIDGVTSVHGIRVHDPRHRLLISIHVR